jgi:hypothetical protein
MDQARRFQPYETYRTRLTEHINVRVDLSTLLPPVPTVGPLTIQPSGGQPKTTTLTTSHLPILLSVIIHDLENLPDLQRGPDESEFYTFAAGKAVEGFYAPTYLKCVIGIGA